MLVGLKLARRRKERKAKYQKIEKAQDVPLSPVQTELSMMSNVMNKDIEEDVLSIAAPLNVAHHNDDLNSSQSSNKGTSAATHEVATPLSLNQFSDDPAEQLTNTSVAKTDTSSDHRAFVIMKSNTASQQNEISSVQCRAVQEPAILVEQNFLFNAENGTASNVLHLQEATLEDKALRSAALNDEQSTPDKARRGLQPKIAEMAQMWNTRMGGKQPLQQNNNRSSKNEKFLASTVLQEPTINKFDQSQKEIKSKPMEGRASPTDPILGKVTDSLQNTTKAQIRNAETSDDNKKPKFLPQKVQNTPALHYDQGKRSRESVGISSTEQLQLSENSNPGAVANAFLPPSSQQSQQQKLTAQHEHTTSIEDIECTLVMSHDSFTTSAMTQRKVAKEKNRQVPDSRKVDTSQSTITDMASDNKHGQSLLHQTEGTKMPESQDCVIFNTESLQMSTLPSFTTSKQITFSNGSKTLQTEAALDLLPITAEEDDVFSLDPCDEDISMFSFPKPAAQGGAAAIGTKPLPTIATKQKGVKNSTSKSAMSQETLFPNKAGDIADELANNSETGPNPNSVLSTWDFPRFSMKMPGFSNSMKQSRLGTVDGVSKTTTKN